MKYIGPNISFIFTKIKELMNSHNTDNSAHSELFKSWKRLRNPNNADIADALAATYKNGIGDVLVEVKDDTTFALEDIKLFFRPARFKLIFANESNYEGIYITMDGTQGRYVAKTFADSEIMTPDGPSTISTPSELALYPAASDAVLYTPQTLTEAQQKQARDNIGALDVNIKTTPVDTDVTLFGRGENIVYVKDGWLRPCPTDADTELVKAYRSLAVQIGGQSTEPIPTAILATASGIYLLYQNGLTSANAKIMPTLLNENRYAIWTISTNNSKHYVSFSVYGVAYSHFCKYCVEDNALVDENFSRAIYSTSTGVGAQTNVKQFRMSAAPTEDMHIATKQYVDTAKTEAQQLGLTATTPGQIIKVKTVQDGKPTEWEAVDMPSGGVQSDWNQNDETAADYVKNRPFYTGNPVETVLVEESTVSFSFSEDDGAYMGELKSTFSATVGETYKVSWDGTVYECACADFHNTPVIGNLSIVGAGANTGEPFIIVPNGSSIYIYTADTSASHTVSISATVVPVVKIDEKYLPISTDDSYGVVKKADIVSAYNLPFLAPHDQMVEAIAAFKTGNASIVWGGYKVIDACYYSSNDTISVVFVNEPLQVTTYSTNSNGFYDRRYRRLGSTTYGELQGNNVRIVNDEGDYIVLVTEGTTGDKNLSVGADRISFYSNCGLSTYELILKSSTANSTKTFKITVDDSGVPTITDESDSTNTWKPTNLPTVTSSDSGKFLRVSDTGEWVAETILSATVSNNTLIIR